MHILNKLIATLKRICGGQMVTVFLTILVVAAFFFGYLQRPSPETTATISQPAPNVVTIEVPVEVITERVVVEYIEIEDQTAALALLEQNDELKIRVEQLSVSLAEAQSSGTGVAVTTVVPPTETAPAVATVTFKDWRLDFTAENNIANYTLTQKFSIVNSVGRDKDNVPTNLIRLYEIGPNDERVLIPTTETTTVAVTGNTPHFYTKLTVQGGVGRAGGEQRIFFATPWLKRGNTTATEDTRWAFLTPMVALSKEEQSVGIAPISFNLGSLARQPLTNLWFSPYVGTTTGVTINQTGFVVSVTF
jgi:hypothetical protein